MLRNYITIALRNFKRNFLYSLINIIGLALGLAGSFVIGSWVWQELSYDEHFKDSESIYRVSVQFYQSDAFARGPEVLNSILQDRASEVSAATRVDPQGEVPIFVGESEFVEKIHQADSNFFDIFSYQFLSGKPETALDNPTDVVVTEDYAMKLFGTTDVLGKSVEVGEDKTSYKVSGVTKRDTKPSHLNINIWLPLPTTTRTNWTSASVFNYIKLQPQASKADLVERLERIKEEVVYPTFNSAVAYSEWKNMDYFDFYAVPLEDIHLDPDMRFEMQPGGNRANVYTFFAVALFLLIIATINFVNLSTAQSMKRAKEVGVRKALGTNRFNLIFQFLTESVVLSLAAMVIGVGLAEVFLILFERFTNETLISGIFGEPLRLLLYAGFSIVIGITAGLYPAFYLSRYKPASILKSGANSRSENQLSRNILVVIQFTVSIALIISSLLVYQQMEFLKQVDIGLVRENVLVIDNAGQLGDKKEAFKNNLLNQSGVVSASYNRRMPAGRSVWIYTFQSQKMDNSLAFQTFFGDDNFIPTIGFNLLEGRNFSKDIASDSLAVILNESAVKDMMLENPINAVLKTGNGPDYHVVGVISDFSYESFYDKPGPIVLLYNPDGYRLSIKLADTQTANALENIKTEWTNLSLEEPMNYSFLDENFEKFMEKEQTLGKTVTFFTTIAIFISCLGLFGLAAFTAEQRKKEIGIRKVLGATVGSIVLLLNKSFTRLVVVAVIISIPLAWYLMSQWLQNFEYKMNMNVIVYAIGGLAALFIAWLTVGYLSFSAASANPVDSLRDE